MDKTFTVQMQSALDSVKVITGYTGRNTTGGIDRIAATNDEETLLTSLSERAFGALVANLDYYKPIVKDYSITITVPANFDTNCVSQVETEATNYVTNYVCAEWFLVARETGDSTAYQSYREKNIKNINTLLSRRLKPTK